MGGLILGKHRLSDQHIEQAAQSPLQREFARVAIFMGFPAFQFGQQLHLRPAPTDAQSIQEACGDPGQGDQSAQRLLIQYLHLFPSQTRFQKLETVLTYRVGTSFIYGYGVSIQ
jgi:hypothetical protein